MRNLRMLLLGIIVSCSLVGCGKQAEIPKQEITTQGLVNEEYLAKRQHAEQVPVAEPPLAAVIEDEPEPEVIDEPEPEPEPEPEVVSETFPVAELLGKWVSEDDMWAVQITDDSMFTLYLRVGDDFNTAANYCTVDPDAKVISVPDVANFAYSLDGDSLSLFNIQTGDIIKYRRFIDE